MGEIGASWRQQMMKKVIASGAIALMLAGTPALAQEDVSTNLVFNERDWNVFIDKDPKECWAVSIPTKSVNTRDGREVSVNRGDILLFVTFRPESGVASEISFTGGYPFAEGSTVTVKIGGTTFEMFTEGEYAWPASAADDAKLITAMKRGADAVMTARSSRGTQTEDTFSLRGFTAAVEDAEGRCAN